MIQFFPIKFLMDRKVICDSLGEIVDEDLSQFSRARLPRSRILMQPHIFALLMISAENGM